MSVARAKHGSERVAHPLVIASTYLTPVEDVIGKAGFALEKVFDQPELTPDEKEQIAMRLGEVIAHHTTQVVVDGDELSKAVSEVTTAIDARDFTDDTYQAVAKLQVMRGQAIIERNARK